MRDFLAALPRGGAAGVSVGEPHAQCCMPTRFACVVSYPVFLDHHRSVLTWGYLATALRFGRPLAHTHEHLVLNGRR